MQAQLQAACQRRQELEAAVERFKRATSRYDKLMQAPLPQPQAYPQPQGYPQGAPGYPAPGPHPGYQGVHQQYPVAPSYAQPYPTAPYMQPPAQYPVAPGFPLGASYAPAHVPAASPQAQWPQPY